MINTDLDQEFRSMAADAPDSGAVRDEVVRSLALRERRRRRTALASSAIAVVLIVGGVVVASRFGQPDRTASCRWLAEAGEGGGSSSDDRADPGGAQERSFFRPADRWLLWQLPDGRYIHALVGAGGDQALMDSGAGLADRPAVLTRMMLVGATLPGYTVEGFTQLATATDLDGASSILCPVGTTSTSGVVTPPCITVMVVSTRTLQADPTDTIKSVTVAGLTTRIDKSTFESTADLGGGFAAELFSALAKEPADLDIATLAASVRLDPSAVVGHSPYLDRPATTAAANASPGAIPTRHR